MVKPKKDYCILIIEDEKEVADIIKTYLSLYPAFTKVVISDSSLNASQKLSNQDFDLIICDLQLGKRSALDFIDKIKKQPKYYNLKFMVVSGCLTHDITLKLMRYGIRNIMVKPFTAKQILINAITCLGIEKKPHKKVNKIIETVKKRFVKEKMRLEGAIPEDALAIMIKNAKNKK